MSQTPNKLQKIFHFDFLFSTISGCTLLLLGNVLGPLMVPDISPLFIVAIGLGLLPWAAFNRYLSRQEIPNSALVRINLTGDVLWIVASVIGLIFAREWLTTFGIISVAGAAMIVAEFAWLKFANRSVLVSASTMLQSS